MEDQKLENSLNLSMSLTNEERQKSPELSTGYDQATKTWELIVKHNGNLELVKEQFPEARIRELLAGYAIVELPEEQIPAFSERPEILYIEKPKQLFFSVDEGRIVSCINSVQTGERGLLGKGVLVAVLDSGIDYTHPDFCHTDGTSRINYMWDQDSGREFSQEEINRVLAGETGPLREQMEAMQDPGGHGTAVAGIAAGNGAESNGLYRGVAPESELLIVKLGRVRTDSFPRTTQLMEGVDAVIRRSLLLGRPAAINISFGNTYGSHEGNTLLEQYLNAAAAIGRTVICVGMGNEGAEAGHAQVEWAPTAGFLETREVPVSIGAYESGFSIQLWQDYTDQFQVYLQHPSGETIGPFRREDSPGRFQLPDTEVLVYYGEPAPYSTAQELYIQFLPAESYITEGIWRFRLVPERIVNGTVDFWLPSAAVLNEGTRFLYPAPERTLTIPAAASGVLSVAAYNQEREGYADFSGRGYTRITNQIKPDLAAPGVNIRTVRSGGGYGEVTGTSFATPFVTGAAALLMEWGIVRGNDPYLYGEKCKAYLRRGARQVPAERVYPNPRLGYGVLCLADSFPDSPER